MWSQGKHKKKKKREKKDNRKKQIGSFESLSTKE
jgi:hypothetical protein